jgi:hypothetical protein
MPMLMEQVWHSVRGVHLLPSRTIWCSSSVMVAGPAAAITTRPIRIPEISLFIGAIDMTVASRNIPLDRLYSRLGPYH